MNIGERIKATRKELGLTQVELAKMAKVHQSTIADLERGRTVSTLSLTQIADALKINSTWLSTGIGSKSAEKNDPITEEILSIYDKLDDKFKKILLEQARMLDKMK